MLFLPAPAAAQPAADWFAPYVSRSVARIPAWSRYLKRLGTLRAIPTSAHGVHLRRVGA